MPGVDNLALDGPTAAKIFNGTIKTWDAPEIKALNQGADLPAEPINVIFRSDESGTTDNFQKYLTSASDGSWTKGVGKAFAGGVGEGAKGNEGTSAAIKTTEGAITYNEWSFATSQKLKQAEIVTSAGPDPVKITTDTVGKTIEGAKTEASSGEDSTARSATHFARKKRVRCAAPASSALKKTKRRTPARSAACRRRTVARPFSSSIRRGG